MDPLSASASVIAVLGALISSLKAADRVIRNLHDAPRELRSLEVEVLDVKAVMADVSIASQLQIENFKTTSSSGDSESSNEILRPSSALPDCLTRAKDIISRLEGTISDSVVCSGGGSYKIRRVAWLKNRKKAEQLRRELKSLKTNLDILLISKAMYHICNLDLRIAGFEAQSNPKHQEIVTLLRRSLQEKPHAVGDIEESVLLSKYTEQRRPSQSSSTQETRPPATMVSPVTELETSAEQGSAITRTLWSAIAPQASIAEDSAQSLEDGTIDLQTRCNCGCHRLAYRSSSLMYITTFGQIVIGAPEDAPCEATCNEYTCRVRSRVVLTATYYLPSWLISKAIILAWVRTPYGNPSFGLRVRNLIPEHSPLISAITEGRIHDIQAIFEQRVFSPDDMEQMGWTTLTWAIHKNQVEVCRFLLNAGADQSLEDGFGRSAIDFAWLAIFEKQVNPNTLRYLQDEFLRNNHDSLDEYEFPVAHRIVLGLETRDLNAMLSEAPYSVINSKDSFGKTALLWASRRGDLEAVQLLLRHGADPNVSDAVRRSPLHMAARSRSVPLIETLIKYGADPRAVNFLNEMPAHYACYEEDSERLVQPFVRSGIDINLASKFGRRLLDIAVQWKYPILVNFLLSCGAKPEASNSHDWKQKLFGRAVISSASDVLEILLRHLGVPTMIDDKGENFLHFLAREADRDFLLHIKVFTVEPHTAEALSHESQRPIDLARSRSDEDFARAFETFLQKLRGVSTQFVGESTHA